MDYLGERTGNVHKPHARLENCEEIWHQDRISKAIEIRPFTVKKIHDSIVVF
jgi:hypothetical protein